MASAGKVDVKVAVKPSVGTSTVAGGTVTVAAYALAIIAFIQGARDEATISAIVVGTVSLVTVLGGRYAQAVAALRSSWGKPAPPLLAPTVQAGTGTNVTGMTWTSPVPGATVANYPGYASFGARKPAADEPGDPDALPDYATTTDPPPDEGDRKAGEAHA